MRTTTHLDIVHCNIGMMQAWGKFSTTQLVYIKVFNNYSYTGIQNLYSQGMNIGNSSSLQDKTLQKWNVHCLNGCESNAKLCNRVDNCCLFFPFVVITIRSSPHSWLITGFITRVPLRVSHVEQELPTLPEHLSSPQIFSRVRVARYLVFCVMFCRSLVVPIISECLDYHKLFLFFWPLYCLSFFDWWLLITLWYLQTLLRMPMPTTCHHKLNTWTCS